MRALVTGGTGFIGQRVVARLVSRGDEVKALVRSTQGANLIRRLGGMPVWGDLGDPQSLQTAIEGCDTLFHIAGWYKLGSRDWQEAEKINVEGTRHVLNAALQAGVKRIVYTSTVAVYGNTHGAIVNEDSPMHAGPFLTEYERTKWIAHNRVVLPLIAQGAPIIIVMPGAVFGPGDPSLVGQMMDFFHRGWLRLLPGPEMAVSWAYVDDVVEGLLLAAEKGKIGESYILAGPSHPLGEMVELWSQVSGTPAPSAYIPARWIKPLAPLVDALGGLLPLPALLSRDSITVSDASYTASGAKAQRELGWTLRPLEDGVRATFASPEFQKGTDVSLSKDTRRLLLTALLGAGFAWLVSRKRKG